MDAREKKILAKENDPRVLKALVEDLVRRNKELENIIAQAELERLQKAQAAFVFEERIKLLKRELFGRSSEKRPGEEALDRARDKSQTEALEFSKAAFPAPVTRDETAMGKSKGRDLPKIEIDHFPSPLELNEFAKSIGVTSPDAETDWIDTGLADRSTKIQIIERSYVQEVHLKHKMKLRDEVKPADVEKDVIVVASPKETDLLPGMSYTTEFVASVATDKYISHMPLERQTREMESLGLHGMKNSTLSRLCALAASSLEPLQEKILREDLIPSDLALHVDETPWKIQNKNEKDGYMWTISNRYGAYYFYKPTRSAVVAVENLKGFTGPVLTDGFTSYDGHFLEAGIPHGYCWAHVRRDFLPLEDHDPTIKPILDLIDRLFATEREAQGFDHLRELREMKSAPLLSELKKLLFEELPRSRPSSQKRKAIEYTLKRWDGLTLFKTDTRLPLSNNEAERTIRHAVMGRKNYYGSGNYSGAETAATLFTIIESAKKNDVDPRTYLLMVLRQVARGKEPETPLAFARRTRSAQPA